MNTLPQVEKNVFILVDGKRAQKQIYSDGTFGILQNNTIKRYLPNGTVQEYKFENDDFVLTGEQLSDVTVKSDSPAENKENIPLSSADILKLLRHKNGELKYIKTRDGFERFYYKNGAKRYEKSPDGTIKTWHKNRQLESERIPFGVSSYWAKSGHLLCEVLPGGAKREYQYFANGAPYLETYEGEIVREWYRNGGLKREKLSPQFEFQHHKNGFMKYEIMPGQAPKRWLKNGNRII